MTRVREALNTMILLQTCIPCRRPQRLLSYAARYEGLSNSSWAHERRDRGEAICPRSLVSSTAATVHADGRRHRSGLGRRREVMHLGARIRKNVAVIAMVLAILASAHAVGAQQ